MVSIPLGSTEIQFPQLEDRQAYMGAVLPQIRGIVQTVVGRGSAARLEAEVTALLGRAPYARRAQAPRRVSRKAQCRQCRTRATWQFRRDGSHPRELGAGWGSGAFRMPQLRCAYGEHVHVASQTVRPYQRLWADVAAASRPHPLRYQHGPALALYAVQAAAAQHGAQWLVTLLRTTSHLERLFRGVRRRVRQAPARHSDGGLLALVQLRFARWAAGQSGVPHEPADWSRRLEHALATAQPIPPIEGYSTSGSGVGKQV